MTVDEQMIETWRRCVNMILEINRTFLDDPELYFPFWAGARRFNELVKEIDQDANVVDLDHVKKWRQSYLREADQ